MAEPTPENRLSLDLADIVRSFEIADLSFTSPEGASHGGVSEAIGNDDTFWEDALRQLLVEAVRVVRVAGDELSLPMLRKILSDASLSPDQIADLISATEVKESRDAIR